MRRALYAWLILGVLLAGAAGLPACTEGSARVAVGREFPMERVVAIRKGSSKREVEDLLGPPWRVTQEEGRRERWRYYARIEKPQTILLVIPNGAEVTERELILVFEGNFVEIIDKKIHHHRE